MDPGGDTKASPDLQWVARFVEWGLQGIVRCRCWGVAVKVGISSPGEIVRWVGTVQQYDFSGLHLIRFVHFMTLAAFNCRRS